MNRYWLTYDRDGYWIVQKATYSKPANDNPGPSWNPYGETDCQ